MYLVSAIAAPDGMSRNEGAEEGGGAQSDESCGGKGAGVGVARNAAAETPQRTGAGNPWCPRRSSGMCAVTCCRGVVEVGGPPPYGKKALSREIVHVTTPFLVHVGMTEHQLLLPLSPLPSS